MTDRYKNGKIYRLVNNVDDKFYVGSTCSPLYKRLFQHRSDARRRPNQPVYKHLNNVGLGNVNIILIEEFPSKNKMEVERRERFYIETLKPTLNTTVPTRTLREYRDKSADKIMENKREYKQKNADQIKEYRREYQQKNADMIKAKKREYRKHNADKINEYQREYRKQNADKIKAIQRKYRQKLKDT